MRPIRQNYSAAFRRDIRRHRKLSGIKLHSLLIIIQYFKFLNFSFCSSWEKMRGNRAVPESGGDKWVFNCRTDRRNTSVISTGLSPTDLHTQYDTGKTRLNKNEFLHIFCPERGRIAILTATAIKGAQSLLTRSNFPLHYSEENDECKRIKRTCTLLNRVSL